MSRRWFSACAAGWRIVALILLGLGLVGPVGSAAAPTAQSAAPAAPSSAPDFFGLPFIPIPEVGTDPNSGTTLGMLGVVLATNPKGEITQVIAPDIIRSPDFGTGARGRIFAYPSDDRQWYVVAGGKQRVERELDALYTTGLTRRGRWSGYVHIVYDRSGTPRFYGVGNSTRLAQETNFTNEQAYLELGRGLNLSREWQIGYAIRLRTVDVLPGALRSLTSLDRGFPNQAGIGRNHELFQRLTLTYDSRDAQTIPHRGIQAAVFAGLSDPRALSRTSYAVAGADIRGYYPVDPATVLASHVALRYLFGGSGVPFWAMGRLGGDRAIMGEQQPLRGFGEGRFVDRNMVSAGLELRRDVFALDMFATRLNLQLAPFVDTGRVFARAGDNPVSALHTVAGLGFRALADPFLVGYVDVGYGSEGTAVFSGINFPF